MNICRIGIVATLVILSFCNMPLILNHSYAQDYHGIKNQTINNIVIENVNATDLVKTLQENNPQQTDEGILISSATIIGFFGFSSFLTVRLEGDKFVHQARSFIRIYMFITAMIIMHLGVILNILILPPFNPMFYFITIGVTIATIIVIAFALTDMIIYQVGEEHRKRLLHRIRARAFQLREEFRRRST